MKLSLNNFLCGIKQIVTGGGRDSANNPKADAGFRRDVPYPLNAIVGSTTAAATAAALTVADGAGTNNGTIEAITADASVIAAVQELAAQINKLVADDAAIRAQLAPTASETNLRVFSSAASTTTVGAVTFSVPRDYDEATDILTLRITAASAGATDTPKLTVSPYRKRAGASIATITAVQGSALSTSAVSQDYTFNGAGLKRDDQITFLITSEAHTTDAILVYAVKPVYISTLVSFNETDGTTPASGSNIR